MWSIPLRCSISLSIFISSPPYSLSASLPHQCSSAFYCVTLASCHLISSFFLLYPARCSSLSLSRLFFFLSLSVLLFSLFLMLITELFQRCLEYFWLCDSSGQHYRHPRYWAWGKYQILRCLCTDVYVFTLLYWKVKLETNRCDITLACFFLKQVWLRYLFGELQNVFVDFHICLTI